MATKKSGPTLAALNAQIAALQAQADALRKKEIAEVVDKIKDAISHYGLTAADLGLATGARKNAKLPAAGGDKPPTHRASLWMASARCVPVTTAPRPPPTA